MSDFEKIIVPLIDDCVRTIDLTECAGFIDCFISDPDHPSSDKELFLVYNDNIRNSFVSDRMKRFEYSKNIKKRYIKYVNNIPYYIYSFWVNQDVKKLYNGIVNLSTQQKVKILQFWGPFDSTVDKVLSNGVLTLRTEHSMPLEDYMKPLFEHNGLTIKKGVTSKDVTPFIFFIYDRMISLDRENVNHFYV